MSETVSLKDHFNEVVRLRDERDKVRYDALIEQSRALKELVLSQAESSARAIGTAMAAADKATDKAAQAYEKRFDNTNEWRDAMNDLQNQFPRKSELVPAIDGLKERTSSVELQLRAATGAKAGITSVGTMVMGSIIVIGTVVNIVLGILNFVARHPS